jgi:hypothetical protein
LRLTHRGIRESGRSCGRPRPPQARAVHLATSLVADLQLVAASVVWVWANEISAQGMTAVHTASMVSLSGGALLANLVSVVLLVTETVTFHRG